MSGVGHEQGKAGLRNVGDGSRLRGVGDEWPWARNRENKNVNARRRRKI